MQRQYAEKTIPGSPNQPGRTELSKEVARFHGHGEASADRIRAQESLWVRFRCFPDSLQGRHAKTHCMLEDEGTLLVMREYMAGAGLHATTEDLANAITVYWLQLAEEHDITL
jgi:hypothetical protein